MTGPEKFVVQISCCALILRTLLCDGFGLFVDRRWTQQANCGKGGIAQRATPSGRRNVRHPTARLQGTSHAEQHVSFFTQNEMWEHP